MVTVLKDGFVVEVRSTHPFLDWSLAVYATAVLLRELAQNEHIDENARFGIGNLGPLLIALANIENKESLEAALTFDEWKLQEAEGLLHRPILSKADVKPYPQNED